MSHPDKESAWNSSVLGSRFITFVDFTPLRSNFMRCPDILLKDKSFVRLIRIILEQNARSAGELVMPFKDTIELSVPNEPLSGDPEIIAAINRERRIKMAVVDDCRFDPLVSDHLRN